MVAMAKCCVSGPQVVHAADRAGEASLPEDRAVASHPSRNHRATHADPSRPRTRAFHHESLCWATPRHQTSASPRSRVNRLCAPSWLHQCRSPPVFALRLLIPFRVGPPADNAPDDDAPRFLGVEGYQRLLWRPSHRPNEPRHGGKRRVSHRDALTLASHWPLFTGHAMPCRHPATRQAHHRRPFPTSRPRDGLDDRGQHASRGCTTWAP